MLTIKNILPNDDEDVFPARRLTFSRAHVMQQTSDDYRSQIPAEVFVETDLPNHDVISLTEGTVYVMNDNGKTVATYHLSYPEPNDEPLMAVGSSD